MNTSHDAQCTPSQPAIDRDSSERPSIPYLFVVGCPRSGTTLLQRMLDHHGQLAVANDTHFIPRVLERCAPERIPAVLAGVRLPLSRTLVDGVLDYHRFTRLGVEAAAVSAAAANAETFAEFVSGLYMAFASARNKPLAGEKTPDYVRHLPLLHGLFPQARTVHIVRDGRNVALSALEWANRSKGPGKFDLWRREPIAVCALWWRRMVLQGRHDGARLGFTSYFEIHYEQLVASPERTLRAIADFIELPFDAKMLAYHAGRRRVAAGRSAKSAWLPPTPGLRDWKSAMPAREVELFEALAGDLLAQLDYSRAFRQTSPAVAHVAAECQAWWDENIKPAPPVAPHARPEACCGGSRFPRN